MLAPGCKLEMLGCCKVPARVDHYLPAERIGQPSRDFCVLYHNNTDSNLGDTVFGVLLFRGSKRDF
jgi:hypothetical protein